MAWGIAYLVLGFVTSTWSVVEYRRGEGWVRDWSDWLLVLAVPLVLLWPFILPGLVADATAPLRRGRRHRRVMCTCVHDPALHAGEHR